MASATVPMLAAIVRFFRKRKWWLKAHKRLNIAALGREAEGHRAAQGPVPGRRRAQQPLPFPDFEPR